MNYPIYLYIFTCLVYVSLNDWLPRHLRYYILLLPCVIYVSGRYGYGNDYFPYMEIFDHVKISGIASAANSYERIEYGWILLNAYFPTSSFTLFVIFISFFHFFAVLKLLKYAALNKTSLFGILIYVFQPLNMLTLLSAMRQSVALTFLVMGMKYVIEGKAIKYSLMVAIASFFHFSAISLLPIYFIYKYLHRINMLYILIFTIILILAVLVFPDQINLALFDFIASSSALNKYDVYFEAGTLSSGAMLVFHGFIIMILSYCFNKERDYARLFILITIIGSMFAVLSASLLILQRFIVYFSLFSMVSIPLSVRVLPHTIHRIGFSVIYILYVFFMYFNAFSNDDWMLGFGDYNSIFK